MSRPSDISRSPVAFSHLNGEAGAGRIIMGLGEAASTPPMFCHALSQQGYLRVLGRRPPACALIIQRAAQSAVPSPDSALEALGLRSGPVVPTWFAVVKALCLAYSSIRQPCRAFTPAEVELTGRLKPTPQRLSGAWRERMLGVRRMSDRPIRHSASISSSSRRFQYTLPPLAGPFVASSAVARHPCVPFSSSTHTPPALPCWLMRRGRSAGEVRADGLRKDLHHHRGRPAPRYRPPSGDEHLRGAPAAEALVGRGIAAGAPHGVAVAATRPQANPRTPRGVARPSPVWGTLPCWPKSTHRDLIGTNWR